MPYRIVIEKGDDFLHWLFSRGTRVVEFLNMLLLIGYTFPLIYNIEAVIENPSYLKMYIVGNPFWWLGMAILGILQWVAMSKKGNHSNQLSGFILMVSGWVWCMISSLYFVKTHPLTPTPIAYLVIGFICVVAGLYTLRTNKKIEDEYLKG